MNVNEFIRTAETNPPAPPLEALTHPEFAAYEDEQDPNVKIAWRIENLGSADWALSRLAECEAEAAAIDAQAEAAVKRIRERAEALKVKAARGAGFFRYKLAEYAERCRDSLLTGKKKSRELLHGKLGFRSKAERLEVVDKDALVAWLSAQPVESGLYRVKVEAEMRALQERFKQTGEVFPGCEVKRESESISIEACAPEKALEE